MTEKFEAYSIKESQYKAEGKTKEEALAGLKELYLNILKRELDINTVKYRKL
ncbi:MAG: hypothetical protein F6K45_23090 [Kamptonema sp. SIO1D9]|nr:hypothetical protein [Kamptonema sp. SIO1D9]